jgi:hypothetical protein
MLFWGHDGESLQKSGFRARLHQSKGNKRTACGRCVERVDEMAELHPTLLHSRKLSVLVTGESDPYSGLQSSAGSPATVCAKESLKIPRTVRVHPEG